MRKGRSVHCLFCEDIRQEVGNKVSYMGVFSGDLIIGAAALPVMMAKFSVSIWLKTPISAPVESATAWVVDPTGTELIRFGPQHQQDFLVFTSDAPPDVRFATLNFLGSVSPVVITTEGLIEAWVEADGERVRAGRLAVKLDTSAAP